MAAASAGTMMFVGVGESVLMWRRGTRDPMLHTGRGRDAGAAGRAAEGVCAGGFCVVGRELDRPCARRRCDESKPLAFSAMSYFEVMPQDGSITRRLVLPPNAETGQIACKDGGTHLSYETDEKKRGGVDGAVDVMALRHS